MLTVAAPHRPRRNCFALRRDVQTMPCSSPRTIPTNRGPGLPREVAPAPGCNPHPSYGVRTSAGYRYAPEEAPCANCRRCGGP